MSKDMFIKFHVVLLKGRINLGRNMYWRLRVHKFLDIVKFGFSCIVISMANKDRDKTK